MLARRGFGARRTTRPVASSVARLVDGDKGDAGSRSATPRPVRSSLAALRTRPGFTSLHATLELRGTDVNQAGSVSRRVITLTR
jgi:hypothetical protein